MFAKSLPLLFYCLLLFSNLMYTEAFWLFGTQQSNATDPQRITTTSGQTTPVKNAEDRCDENQLLFELARLYVTSPERIVLLLSLDTPEETCAGVTEVLHHINNTLAACKSLAGDNLYMKLYNGLRYYNAQICSAKDDWKSKKHIKNYHSCLSELREDLIDCEGPADWFEKTDKNAVCQTYNDIINCNYIKAAMLCGLTPARMLRGFSDEVMKRVVMYKCSVSRSLPHVDDPMPSYGVHGVALLSLRLYLLFTLAIAFI